MQQISSATEKLRRVIAGLAIVSQGGQGRRQKYGEQKSKNHGTSRFS
jgi:hypothetical protein